MELSPFSSPYAWSPKTGRNTEGALFNFDDGHHDGLEWSDSDDCMHDVSASGANFDPDMFFDVLPTTSTASNDPEPKANQWVNNDENDDATYQLLDMSGVDYLILARIGCGNNVRFSRDEDPRLIRGLPMRDFEHNEVSESEDSDASTLQDCSERWNFFVENADERNGELPLGDKDFELNNPEM